MRQAGVQDEGARMSGSQCDRVLAVLKDGRPHTMVEIHEAAGFMRLNSRISDLRHRLRDRGQTITCRRDGEHYVYQLVALEEPDPLRERASGSSSVPAPAAAASLSADDPVPGESLPPGHGTLLLFDPPRRGAYNEPEAA